MNDACIEVQDVELAYRRGPRILRLDEAIVGNGEVVSVVGPNGGGKTTLLRCIAGLMPPRRGSVRLDGRDIYGRGALSRRERARAAAVVLTDVVAPAYLHVDEIVSLGRLPHLSPVRRSNAVEAREVREAMAATGVSHLAGRFVGEVSDGERQRVMIARALAQRPRVLLLDEPAAHLDPPHQTGLFLLLRDLVARGAIRSAVLATHHLHLAMHFSDSLLVVYRGGAQSGTSEELTRTGAIERAFGADAPAMGLSPQTHTPSGRPTPRDDLRFDPQRGWFIPRSIG